jgi:hypothetical protein
MYSPLVSSAGSAPVPVPTRLVRRLADGINSELNEVPLCIGLGMCLGNLECLQDSIPLLPILSIRGSGLEFEVTARVELGVELLNPLLHVVPLPVALQTEGNVVGRDHLVQPVSRRNGAAAVEEYELESVLVVEDRACLVANLLTDTRSDY